MLESIRNILCDLSLTLVQVLSTLINIKPMCFINMINTSYCGKSHWNGVKSNLLQNSSFLKNASADFAQNFTNERRNSTNCFYEIFFFFFFFFIFMNYFLKYNSKQNGCILIGSRCALVVNIRAWNWKFREGVTTIPHSENMLQKKDSGGRRLRSQYT